MKKFLISTAVAAFSISGAMAGADLQAHCEAVSAEMEDGDPSGCACLAETATGDAKEELLAFQAGDDSEALSEASKEAIATCWPESEGEG